MKINFLLAAIITATICSCSTSYKTGQTPDDVYYSPVRLQNDNVRRDNNENKNVYDNSVYSTPEDREIRRRVHNRRYRRYDDRYGRYDDRYDYPYGYNDYSPVYINPKSGRAPNTSQPRKTNLGAYTPHTISADSIRSTNPKLGMQNNSGATNNGTANPVRTFDTPGSSSGTPNNGSGVGNFIRKIFSGDNSNNTYTPNSSNNSSPSRTFESRNSNSSSNNNSSSNSNTNSSSTNSSSSSTSAPVRTFKKDN